MMNIYIHNPEYQASAVRPMGGRVPDRLLELTWYIGMELPKPLDEHNKHLVVCVEADGDELEIITRNCGNIPYMPGSYRFHTWRGEIAQFIVDNVVDSDYLRRNYVK